MRIRKAITIAAVTVALCGLGVLGFHKYFTWEYKDGRYYHYGYWDEFRNVTNALASMPGISIVDTWYNEDLTLEEFGFTILVNSQRVSLGFAENDPIRSFKGNALSEALSRKIAEQRNVQAH